MGWNEWRVGVRVGWGKGGGGNDWFGGGGGMVFGFSWDEVGVGFRGLGLRLGLVFVGFLCILRRGWIVICLSLDGKWKMENGLF